MTAQRLSQREKRSHARFTQGERGGNSAGTSRAERPVRPSRAGLSEPPPEVSRAAGRKSASLLLPSHLVLVAAPPRCAVGAKIKPAWARPAPPLASRSGPATGRLAARAMVRAEAALPGPAPPQSPGRKALTQLGASAALGCLGPLLGPPGRHSWGPGSATPGPLRPYPRCCPRSTPESVRERAPVCLANLATSQSTSRFRTRASGSRGLAAQAAAS